MNWPNYPSLNTSSKLDYGFAVTQLWVIGVVYFFNQYIVLVIMLNFLIAVINDTYQRVMKYQKMYKYQYRN